MMLLALLATAAAKSWCAQELVVHEWGVAVFPASGEELPSYFHTGASAGARDLPSVLDLPADTGERAKPVVSFHIAHPEHAREIPLALSVGFTQGRPKAWYPQADIVRDDPAWSVPAEPYGAGRQLVWDPLTLSSSPKAALPWTTEAWVLEQREIEGLYVNRGIEESERFLFYEGLVSEEPVVQMQDGVLVNTGDWPVHDVLWIEPDGRFMAIETLKPGESVQPWAAHQVVDPRRWLLDRLSLPPYSAPATGGFGLGEDCVMMRDPAVPVERARDHRIYRDEVMVLLEAWEEELFEAEQPVLVYREDLEQLQSLVPMSVYTDMFWYPTLRRLSLVITSPTSPSASQPPG